MISRKRSFILKIDIPVFLAFILFSGLIFFYLIPGFEKTMMEQKRKLMHEIAASAHSILDYYHSQEKNGALTTENAMAQAKSAIGNLRYGEELKDYLWITDTVPRMVIHPYRPDLNGADLTGYRDSKGKQVFVEFTDAVIRDGESFVDYMWQWNDDTTQNVPKLSYVRLFRPWSWVIGTGIYLQDIKTEIARIEKRALLISGVIGILIILLLIIVTTQSHRIEQRRKKAEQEVLKSHELYRTLAEATSEGVLIWSADGLQANKTLLTWLGYKEEKLKSISPGTIINSPEIREFRTSDSFADQLETNKFIETEVTTSDGGIINAHAELSTIKMGGSRAVLFVLRRSTKEARESISFPASLFRGIETGFFRTSPRRKFRFIYASGRMAGMLGFEEAEELSALSLEVFFADPFELEYFRSLVDNCPAYTIRDVIMKKKDGSVFTANMNVSVSDSAGGEPVCEGTLELMAGRDQTAIFRYNDPDVFKSLINSRIAETGKPDNIVTLKRLFNSCRNTAISMIKAGDDASSVSLFISAVSDEICRSVIDICIAEAGEPPCRFAFILTGSAGRMEQTLSTDQDNAIIFEECSGDKLKRAADYFVNLGQKVNSMLDLAGFRYCKGLNMAGNPRWSQPVNVWKDYFSGWTRNPGPVELLDISIYFDFRFCAGDPGLAEELRLFIKKDLGTNDIFFHHMALALKQLSPALNKSNAGRADLKKILMPLTGVIRLYALKHGTGGYSTMERLALLSGGKYLGTGLLRISARAWDDLTSLRLTHQADCIDNGNEPDNTIDLNIAGKCHYATVDQSVAIVKELMLKAGTDFLTDVF